MKSGLSVVVVSLALLASSCAGTPASAPSTPSTTPPATTASSSPTPKGAADLTAANFDDLVTAKAKKYKSAKLTWTTPGGTSFQGEVSLPNRTDVYQGTWTENGTSFEIARVGRKEAYINHPAYGPGWHDLKDNKSAQGSAIRASISANEALLLVSTMSALAERIEILEKAKVADVDTTHVRLHAAPEKTGEPVIVDYWLDDQYRIIRMDSDALDPKQPGARTSAIFQYQDKELTVTKPA